MSGDGHWLVQGMPPSANFSVNPPNPPYQRNSTGEAIVWYRAQTNNSTWIQQYLLKPDQWFIGVCVCVCSDSCVYVCVRGRVGVHSVSV